MDKNYSLNILTEIPFLCVYLLTISNQTPLHHTVGKILSFVRNFGRHPSSKTATFSSLLNCPFLVMMLITFSPESEFKNSNPMELAEYWCEREPGSLIVHQGITWRFDLSSLQCGKDFSNKYRCYANFLCLTITTFAQVTFALHSFPLKVCSEKTF